MVKKKKKKPVSHKIDSSFTETSKKGVSKAVSDIKSVSSTGEKVRVFEYQRGDKSYSSVSSKKGGKSQKEITYTRKVKGRKTKTTTLKKKSRN